MSDFAPPTGPPPPKLPEGWKAVWNDQYSEWFFVNIYTKKSQWDKPNSPVYPPGEGSEMAPDHPPPSYSGGAPAAHGALQPEKGGLGSNNPFQDRKSHDLSEDEKLARQLQEEENARAGRTSHEDRGANSGYYAQQGAPQYGQPQQYGQQQEYGQGQPAYAQDTQEKGKSKGGLLGKLLGKASGASSSKLHGYPQQQQYPQQYGQPGYGQPGYGQPAYGYPQQQQMYGRKKPGMGVGTGAALGVGGGLLGGMLLGEAMSGDGGDGGDYGGDGGGDFGGGDGGGDFGGGDMGGGDF